MQENSSKKLYCPVPKEQRPLNEFLNLKTSSIFNWPTFNTFEYILKIFNFGGYILFFSIPISNYCYYYYEFPNKFFLLNLVIVFTSKIFLLLRIYLGWYYIKERLTKSFVEYEESGWYDGQIWFKPIKVLKLDRLIFYYKVAPILKRLKKTIIYCLCILVIIFWSSIVLW